MAGMNAWLLATTATVPAFAIAAIAACCGPLASRFAAVQLATALATILLVMMTFAFHQSAFADLALALALLSLPGTLVMAMFVERWL